MAGIDKTYISNWEVFDKIRNWAREQSFKLKNGQVIKLIDYMYYPNLTKKEWDEWHDERIQYAIEHYNTPEYIKELKELYGDDWEFNPENYFDVVLWNTPVYVDIWLIRNCPFEEIQDRLKEQYGGGWSKTALTEHKSTYEQIKNYCSIYDTYQRNGLGKRARVSFYNIYGKSFRDKNSIWQIEVNPYWFGKKRSKFKTSDTYWYNETDNMWYKEVEAMPWTCSNMFYKGNLNKKKIIKMIKKWDLPKGSIVKFEQSWKRYSVHEFYCTVK